MDVWQDAKQTSETVIAEAVSQRWSANKEFLDISQNPEENISARVTFLINFQASCLQVY